jgi:hypothetical protein
MKDYEIKQNEYKKSIEVLHLIERKRDQIYDKCFILFLYN